MTSQSSLRINPRQIGIIGMKRGGERWIAAIAVIADIARDRKSKELYRTQARRGIVCTPISSRHV